MKSAIESTDAALQNPEIDLPLFVDESQRTQQIYSLDDFEAASGIDFRRGKISQNGKNSNLSPHVLLDNVMALLGL